MNPERLRHAFAAAGQGHVFAAYDRLTEAERARFLTQLAAVDLGLTARLSALAAQPAHGNGPPVLEPPEVFPLRRNAAEMRRATRAEARGRELLAAGRVGYVLVAGGQASRLGYEGPKGAFPVAPVSGRTLFELHARRLLRASRTFGVPSPWYVMTSPANDADTRAFFERHRFFGLPAADVRFFAQEMLPALDEQGRILLAGRDALFLAPNGHGGVLQGLRDSGAVADMRARGLTQLSYFQVDNPLVRPADPLFLGLHDLAQAGMSSKFVRKRDALEKVGVIGRVDGKLGCIEYSDMPAALREARDAAGELRFGAGNIAVHVLAVDFLDELTSGDLSLPWHVARKQMKTVEPTGVAVERTGFKFETFVFDALARAERSVTLEVERSYEFSPVKNATGEDSPATARADLRRMHAAWLRAAGLPLPPAAEDGHPNVEVDPLLAETEADFHALEAPKPHVGAHGHLYE